MAKELISAEEEEQIVEAIRTAEKNTSGEIRVHLEKKCPIKILDRAKAVFHELKMDNTKLENGVLIYLALEDRQFYILGDKGIDKKVPDNFWESTKDIMLAHFKKDNFKQGLIDGILKAGEQLKQHFPYQQDDINELSDEISRG
ncbi:TPM domain-containing protein [Mesonia aestuariivivens]|uniref:TPM domain-containing protein n=1 Tax=Mesonia aestuariivivens TaxID=2796128 RepID=A0ABS6W3D7_9FLAO|nr:TPM domain-containing protein [Mesonia aestuariivivens]MBW2962376.1 TPM domain-containing protein [Mesonia aestuariivivens]